MTEPSQYLLPSLNSVDLVCPRCRGSLELQSSSYLCLNCGATYHLQGGIPNMRVFPDPYLTDEEDKSRTGFIIEALDRYRLQPLLEYYWSVSDVTPVPLREKFIRSVMLGEKKAERILRILSDTTFREPVRAQRALEIGSGTGNFLAAANSRFKQTVGIDIAMRWLHVSRRRFMDRDIDTPPLVCCCAESLPFPDSYFDLIVCSATLEFTRDHDQVFREWARVLTDDGAVYISTVNRYSITQDPYVYLWGVGFLPRTWQAGYVRWRRQASYENIRLHSFNEIRSMARKHFSAVEFALPDISDEALQYFPVSKRLQVYIYRLLKRIPGVRSILLRIAPQWDIKLGSVKKPAA